MALLRSIELDSGLSVTNAYARVDNRSGGNKTEMNFALNYYISQQAFMDGKAFVKQEHYSFEPSVDEGAPNDIKQCYEHLKTLQEFADSIDVLEE